MTSLKKFLTSQQAQSLPTQGHQNLQTQLPQQWDLCCQICLLAIPIIFFISCRHLWTYAVRLPPRNLNSIFPQLPQQWDLCQSKAVLLNFIYQQLFSCHSNCLASIPAYIILPNIFIGLPYNPLVYFSFTISLFLSGMGTSSDEKYDKF